MAVLHVSAMSLLHALYIATLVVAVVGVHVVAERATPAGLVSFPVQRGVATSPMSKRSLPGNQPLIGGGASLTYYVQLSLGTPAQPLTLYLGTDYNETWVNPSCTDDKTDDVAACQANGYYDPSKSTTTHNTAETSQVSYLDGRSASWTYFTDSMTLSSGQSVSDVRFGVANDSQGFQTGFLGLGVTNFDRGNFIDQLATQGVTNTKAFSLALGNSTDQGVVIFGGVDTMKFTGQLVANEILPPPPGDTYARYWIHITSVGFERSDGSSGNYDNSSADVTLDSGTTLSYLPDPIANAVFNDLQATWDEDLKYAVVACSQQQNPSFFTFSFSNVTINVPVAELVFKANDTLCIAGITKMGGDLPTLGLNFLRSAYVVFDQSFNQKKILMAQYVDCGSNEQVITNSGAEGIIGECGNTTTSPSTEDPLPDPSSGASAGLSAGGKAGVGVGAVVAGVIIAALVYLFFRRRRRTAEERAASAYPETQHAAYYNPREPQELEGQPVSWGDAYRPGHTSMAMTETTVVSPQSAAMKGQQWDPNKYASNSPLEVGRESQHAELWGDNQHYGPPHAPNVANTINDTNLPASEFHPQPGHSH